MTTKKFIPTGRSVRHLLLLSLLFLAETNLASRTLPEPVERAAVGNASSTVLCVEQVTPLTYEKRNGRLMVRSRITLPVGTDDKSVTLKLDGKELPFEQTKEKGIVLAWLPMVGGDNVLECLCAKQTLTRERIAAPIPGDWGNFGQGEIHLIQATHQDIAWMDTPEYCRHERVHDIVVPALQMMKEDPNFTFEMEQTLNLMEFLDEFPDRKEELIQRYKEGRFHWGATYNQPYEGLSSGEQLVRQAYYGRKWIKENLPGCDDRTASNMDVPGRAMQMPQILAKSGIKNLFISRHREGLYDWASPDGTSVLTWSLGHYGWEKFVWHFFDAGTLQAFRKVHNRVRLWEDYYVRHQLPPCYAVLMSSDASKPDSYSALIREWNEIAALSETPLPRIRYSTAEAYLEAMDTPQACREQISGERANLWLYIHGPAHYEQTLDKRKAAVLLPAAEFFSSMAWLSGREYPKACLDRGWMAALYPDHGLGGKNGAVTDSIFGDSLAVGRAMGENVLRKAAQGIAEQVKGKKGDVILFNDLSWERTSMAEVAVENPRVNVQDADGKPLPSQITVRGDSTFVRFLARVPALGYARFILLPSKKSVADKVSGEVQYGDNYYANRFYDITLGNGGIVRLFDKEANRDLMAQEKYAFGDVIEVDYQSHGAGEHTRIPDLSMRYGELRTLSRHQAEWKVVEEGPLYVTFQNITPGAQATFVQRITVWNEVKKIDFDVRMQDFTGAHNLQYRILFPLNMKTAASDICYEVPMAVSHVGKDELQMIPGGWSAQGTYSFHPSDSHPREVQNFLSANGNGFGVTMSSCVAVCDWVDPAVEAADYPVLQGILLSSHRSCHGEGNWYHQTGTHDFHFSISSHPEGWQHGQAQAISENHPLLTVRKEQKGGTLPSTSCFMEISDPLVHLCTLKKADNENALVLRVVEMEGRDKDVTIRMPRSIQSALRCNMIEEDTEEEIPFSSDDLHLHLGHHAIETIKIKLQE